jgi:hypothetical protein
MLFKIHTPAQTASLFIGGTLGLQWARVTVLDIGPVAALSVSRLPLHKVQFFACWTDVDIARRLIAEALWAKECDAVVVIGKGNVGVDVLPFNGCLLQRKQAEWLSKEPAVFRRVWVDATTARHVLAASSPGRR